MIMADKQFSSQTTFLSTSWNVLSNNIQDRFINDIEGVTRSLLEAIPPEFIELIYAEGNNHRPAEFGANFIMALLYIRATGISEQYFLQHIHSDGAMQYAINTENERNQPFSDNTLYRLRKRLECVYTETGRDLLEEITDMMNFAMETEVIGNEPYNELLNKVYRIDSLNIGMHGRHMSRLELVYVINRMNINNINAMKGNDAIPVDLRHYLDKQDHNRVIYFKGTLQELEAAAVKKGISVEEIEAELEAELEVLPSAPGDDVSSVNEDKSEPVSETDTNPASQQGNSESTSEADAASATAAKEQQSKKTGEFNRQKRCKLIARLRLEDVIQEALAIQKLVKELNQDDTKEYKLLERLLGEQTKLDDAGHVIPRENSEIKGSSLQSPYDDFENGPTCRTKDGKTTQGWSANIVQRCGSGDYAIIVGRDLEPNTHSDQAFARDFYNKFGIDNYDPKSNSWNGVCCDGLYCNSYELKELAAARGFKVFCGTLTGIAPDPILAGFDIDLKNMEIHTCPKGEAVKKAVPHLEKEEFRIRMPAGTCSECKNCKKCGAKILKNDESSILLKLKQYNEANTMRDLGDPVYREMVNKRNAVEGVPSVLRRKYHIDQTTYFGKWYARYDLMLDTTAMNMSVLLRYRQEKRKKEMEASQNKAA